MVSKDDVAAAPQASRDGEVWRVADADVAAAEYVRGLVVGLSWADLPELIAYAQFLTARKASR